MTILFPGGEPSPSTSPFPPPYPPDDPRNYLSRLHDLPGVQLRPFDVPLTELWERAPAALQARAREPLGPLKRALFDAMRVPKALGTEVVARVPIWVPEYEVGYVLDFLFPEYGVNLQIDAYDPRIDEDEDFPFEELDFDAEPDHPHNHDRDAILREALGIEVLHYWDCGVEEMGLAVMTRELRYDLGIGRPAEPRAR